MTHMSACTRRCQPHGTPSQRALKFNRDISEARFGENREKKEEKEKQT